MIKRAQKDLLFLIQKSTKDGQNIITQIKELQKIYKDISAMARKLGTNVIRNQVNINIRSLGVSHQALQRIQPLEVEFKEEKEESQQINKNRFQFPEEDLEEDETLGLSFLDDVE